MVCCAQGPPVCPCCHPAICKGCEVCCCQKTQDPLFDGYPLKEKCPPGAKEFMGVEVEYIDDPKYLYPPLDAPKQETWPSEEKNEDTPPEEAQA